jgi:catechol 2,3-dioxygenase-like lactoylglutathione lyase family enzyme
MMTGGFLCRPHRTSIMFKSGGFMLRVGSIVWGVRDVPRAIAFWSAALDYRLLREPDIDWAILVPNAGHGPQLALKLVTSPSEDHQRHHLDLYASDRVAETKRLHGLGATPVDWRYEPGADYVVLADPDGNRFCVIEKLR